MSKLKCGYHELPYDGSRRFDKSNATKQYSIGYEMRWISDNSNNKYTLACNCGKGHFPGKDNNE